MQRKWLLLFEKRHLHNSDVISIIVRFYLVAQSTENVVNIIPKANFQSTIVKRFLNGIFNLKKSIIGENPGAHFNLKISANQRLGA